MLNWYTIDNMSISVKMRNKTKLCRKIISTLLQNLMVLINGTVCQQLTHTPGMKLITACRITQNKISNRNQNLINKWYPAPLFFVCLFACLVSVLKIPHTILSYFSKYLFLGSLLQASILALNRTTLLQSAFFPNTLSHTFILFYVGQFFPLTLSF